MHDSVRRVYAKLQYPCKMAASFRRNGCCAVLLRMKTNEGLNAFFNFVEESTTKYLAYAALNKEALKKDAIGQKSINKCF